MMSRTRVKWDNAISEPVSLISGVKQGGVLSPILLDTVLAELEDSKLGCFINRMCFNSFMYADDLILISSSVSDLECMLKICERIFIKLDMPVNLNKSHCIRIGPRFNAKCSSICLSDTPINWVEEIDFLGIRLKSCKNFRCAWSGAKKKFFSSANAIVGKLGTKVANYVTLKLIYTNSIPALMYGTIATGLDRKDISELSRAYDSIYAKIFKSFNKDVILQCQYCSGFWPAEMFYKFHRFTFLDSLRRSGKISSKSVIDTPDCLEVKAIGKKYSICDEDSVNSIKYKFWRNFSKRIEMLQK